MAHNKRTKKKYQELFDNPANLFGDNVNVILWPNGEPEIWIKDRYGRKGFSIRASKGKAGFSVTVRGFAGADDTTLLAYDKTYAGTYVDPCREVTLCQYDTDNKAQAFKAWYIADSENSEHKKELWKAYEAIPEKE